MKTYVLCGVIEGSLPIGGLSSLAAVTIAFLSALCDVNNIKMTAHDMLGKRYDIGDLASYEYVQKVFGNRGENKK